LIKEIKGRSLCSSPCDHSSQVAYDDGHCEESCNDPYVAVLIHDVKVCVMPPDDNKNDTNVNNPNNCTPEQFILQNSSCVDECKRPMQKITGDANGPQLCKAPCEDDKVYQVGNCIESCPFGFEISPNEEYGYNFCKYSCPVEEFLYPDGSCGDTCIDGMRDEFGEYDIQYCKSKCLPEEVIDFNFYCSDECSEGYNKTEYKGVFKCDFVCQKD